jgi:uncharacterized protein (DUF1778 family)
MIVTKENRETRFSIRVTTKQKEFITRAALKSNKTISEFVLENAIQAAEAIELDNANFVLNKANYQNFLNALDAPIQTNESLKNLLNKPSVFDGK